MFSEEQEIEARSKNPWSDLESTGSDDLVQTVSNDSIIQHKPSQACPHCRHVRPLQKVAPSDSASLASDESEPWAGKLVLCIDGGGVRGVSTLLVLRELVRKITELERRTEPFAKTSIESPLNEETQSTARTATYSESSSNFLLCHYFDYIAGSSFGGLISIMLGRLRMSVDETLSRYEQLFTNVFSESRRERFVRIFKHTHTESSYSFLRRLRPALSSPEEAEKQFHSDAVRCRTIVCSFSDSKKGVSTPYLFTTYDSSWRSLSTEQVVRATTASATYLKSFTIGGRKFKDGGVGLSNPSIQILNEVDRRHRHPWSLESVNLFLSLGCVPFSEPSTTTKSISETLVISRTFRSSVISEAVHETMQKQSSSFRYYRFEPKGNTHHIKYKDLASNSQAELESIKKLTEAYLRDRSVQARLQECAEILVEKRRQRSETLRWESFALGIKYKCMYNDDSGSCQMKNSHGQKPIFKTQNDLLDHLREYHRMAPPSPENYETIETLIDKGRTHSDRSNGTDDAVTQHTRNIADNVRQSSQNADERRRDGIIGTLHTVATVASSISAFTIKRDRIPSVR